MIISYRKLVVLLALLLSVLWQPLHAATEYDLCQQDDATAEFVVDHGDDGLDTNNDHASGCCGAGCTVLFSTVAAAGLQTPSSEYNETQNYYSYLRLPRLDRPPSLI